MLSTKHVVLGLVIERAGYGYDLQQRIDRRLGFLGLSDNVIYGVLDRLEREGLIAERGAKLAGQTKRGSPRVTYVATDAGVTEFERWIAAPSKPAAVREELHAKIVVAAPEHVEHLVVLAQELELTYLRQLQQRVRGRDADLDDPELSWEALGERLVDEAHAMRIEATIRWLQTARAVLERRMHGPAAIR